MSEGTDIQEIDRALRQFFVAQGLVAPEDVGDLTEDTRLADGGMLNSLTQLELAMFIEERFLLELGPRDLDVDNFGTYGALVAFVERRMRAAASDASR